MSQQEIPQADLVVQRLVTAEPPLWLRVPGQPWRSVPRPTAKPFDLANCLARLRKLNTDDLYSKGWTPCRIEPALSPAEAAFWLEAMTQVKPRQNLEEVVANLAGRDYQVLPTQEETIARLREAPVRTPALILPVVNLLPAEVVCRLFLGEELVKDRDWGILWHLFEGWQEFALPYLTEADAERARKVLREVRDPTSTALIPWAVAGAIGAHEELRARVATLPDGQFKDSHYISRTNSPQMIVLGVGDGKEAETQARRLQLPLTQAEHVHAWLALTGWKAVDYVRDCILPPTVNKATAEPMMKALAAGVTAPEVAPVMLELRLTSKAPGPARQWLDEQPANAIAGLLPLAAEKGKRGEAAIDYLREAKKRGHADFIEAQLQGQPENVAAAVRSAVLEHEEKEYEPLDARTTPAWLQAPPSAKTKLPAWVASASLPPILLGGRRLTDEQSRGVLTALQGSPLANPQPLLPALRQHAERVSLDSFVWKLFEAWLAEGAPAKDKWAMQALGHLGSDEVALKLTPLVRAWPGESQHQRAVAGLEVLRAIGTDTALMQLHGIAQRVKFKGVQNRAREFLEAIARDRNLTREQLEDRIVPDLGLDERGRRVFDFGPRQFRLVLGPDLRPLVRDEADKVKEDLPKPGAKDDAEKAKTAVADWKLLKKQMREVVKIQAFRLEQAMVTGRRWTAEEFPMLLVRHPLMVHLARRLVWGGYDGKGKRVRMFRVTEDQDYTDMEDRPCVLDGVAAVGILHPLQLSEAERGKWGNVFGDYEIIAPFPQLGREVFGLEKGEEKASEITRFAGRKLPGVSVASSLEKAGWQRGPLHDHGDFYEHHKQFPSAEVTAVTHYEPGLWASNIADPVEVEIKSVVFLKGLAVPSWWDRSKVEPLPLAKVDAVVLSEVLADLLALTRRGN